MGRSYKKHDVKKQFDNFRFNRKGDGKLSVGVRLGMPKADQSNASEYAEGVALDGGALMFQREDNLEMLLAPVAGCVGGKNLITHKLEAALQDLRHGHAMQERAARAAQPAPLQRASIHAVDASTYAGNDLGPITMGDWVTRKGQTERYQVTAMRILNGTTQAKTDRKNSRWTNIDRFEHAREVTPEPAGVDLQSLDATALQDIVAQTVAAILAARQ